jgi:broad specificity phosphatase PhoE/ribonuclease HI
VTARGPLRVIVEADGGARGNPGPAGYGAVVREANTGEVLVERSDALGIATNNVAEYSGLLAGLRAAVELGAAEVEVRMDSKLVVEQMSGRWQIKHPGLRPLAAQAAALVRRFDLVTFVWIPRERNKHADALANKAMDEAAGTVRGAGARARSAGAPVGKDEPAEPAAGSVRSSWEPPVATPTRLLLVRHGATALTAQRRYSGRGDVPLSEQGLAQARATAARVKALAPTVAAVVTSPLVRCTRTAEVIASVLGGAPVEVEPDLVECDFGAWEGKTFSEVRAEWPDEMDAWLASTEEAPPGGESFRAVATRVRRVVATLHKTYPESTLVVVSHVSPLKILLRDALAAGDALLHRLYLDPAGLSIVDMWADGGVAVRMVNETAHLS